MVDDRTEPTGPLDPDRPRRAPTTIELPASEVTSETSGPTASDAAEPPATPETPEETAAESIADPVAPEDPVPPPAKRPSVLLPAPVWLPCRVSAVTIWLKPTRSDWVPAC